MHFHFNGPIDQILMSRVDFFLLMLLLSRNQTRLVCALVSQIIDRFYVYVRVPETLFTLFGNVERTSKHFTRINYILITVQCIYLLN